MTTSRSKLTKYERISEQVRRNYAGYSEEQIQRVIKQEFAKWLVRGETISRNMDTGKLTVSGPNIALKI